jgi:hypothetical protein
MRLKHEPCPECLESGVRAGGGAPGDAAPGGRNRLRALREFVTCRVAGLPILREARERKRERESEREIYIERNRANRLRALRLPILRGSYHSHPGEHSVQTIALTGIRTLNHVL